MEDVQIRIKCLELTQGNIEQAQVLYNWIVGNN